MDQPGPESHEPDAAVGTGVARYTLVGPCGRTFRGTVPGTLGGHRRGRLYGRLDCPSALRVIAQGGYVRDRVFFRDEATAVAAGYRPCAVCLPREYRRWKSQQESPACRARWEKEGTT